MKLLYLTKKVKMKRDKKRQCYSYSNPIQGVLT